MIALLVSALISAVSTSASENCEVRGEFRMTIFVYCPKEMKMEDTGAIVKEFGKIHFHKASNQIHVHVFNEKKLTPKDMKVFMKMSDADEERTHVGVYDLNKNTGLEEYLCKRNPKDKEFSKCNDFLK